MWLEVVTRAQYAEGLCVWLRLYVYMCVCRQKNGCFASALVPSASTFTKAYCPCEY